MFQNGRGVIRDYKLANKYYRLSADQDNALAQHYLGRNYRDALGVKKDVNEAKKWFKKSADQGNEDANEALKALEEIKP